MNRDQALAKIKKCMALGRSSNPHEAAAAVRQAQKLMEQHGISESDVALADVIEVNCRAAMTGPRWEVRLANLVAEAFGCNVLWIAREKLIGRSWRRVHSVSFVGVGAAPQVASYAWAVLDRQCAQQRLAHIRQQPKTCKPITRTARGDAFADGWVGGIRGKLTAFAGEKHQALIEQFMEKNHPNTTSASVTSRAVGRNVRHDSVTLGFLAGKNAQLDRGVCVDPVGLLQ
jgi:hypothetical protein